MSQRVAAWLWKERPNHPATNISATKTQSKIIQQTNCQNLQTKKITKTSDIFILFTFTNIIIDLGDFYHSMFPVQCESIFIGIICQML